jgi:Immunoglobulin I-set domain
MFWNFLRSVTATNRRSAVRRESFRPTLESLEDRAVPSAPAGLFGLSAKPPVVHAAVKHPGIVAVAPKITLQPTPQTVVLGTLATFTAAASGTPTPTVQWQMKAVGGKSFTNIGGATSPTFSFTPALADNAEQFRAVFTNSKGKVTTKAALLYMTVQGPAASVVTDSTLVGDGSAGNPLGVGSVLTSSLVGTIPASIITGSNLVTQTNLDAQLSSIDTTHPWVLAGQVSNISSITSTYPLSAYAYGIKYNGAFGQIQEVVITSWNQGTRIATTEPYFTGDVYNTMQLTYVVLLQGLSGLPDNTNWFEYYYTNNGSGGYTETSGNGNSNTTQIYVRQL